MCLKSGLEQEKVGLQMKWSAIKQSPMDIGGTQQVVWTKKAGKGYERIRYKAQSQDINGTQKGV